MLLCLRFPSLSYTRYDLIKLTLKYLWNRAFSYTNTSFCRELCRKRCILPFKETKVTLASRERPRLDKSGGHRKTSPLRQNKFYLTYFFQLCIWEIFTWIDENRAPCICVYVYIGHFHYHVFLYRTYSTNEYEMRAYPDDYCPPNLFRPSIFSSLVFYFFLSLYLRSCLSLARKKQGPAPRSSHSSPNHSYIMI